MVGVRLILVTQQIKHTAKSISFIHSRLSAGYFDAIVESNSMRLTVADRGATPAKPYSMARRIGRPYWWTNTVLASPSASLLNVRRTRVSCPVYATLPCECVFDSPGMCKLLPENNVLAAPMIELHIASAHPVRQMVSCRTS